MKLILEINGQKIELTIEEAEKLHGDLARLFSKPAPYLPQIPRHPIFPENPTWTPGNGEITWCNPHKLTCGTFPDNVIRFPSTC